MHPPSSKCKPSRKRDVAHLTQTNTIGRSVNLPWMNKNI